MSRGEFLKNLGYIRHHRQYKNKTALFDHEWIARQLPTTNAFAKTKTRCFMHTFCKDLLKERKKRLYCFGVTKKKINVFTIIVGRFTKKGGGGRIFTKKKNAPN